MQNTKKTAGQPGKNSRTVRSMSGVLIYGEQIAQEVEDQRWIALAAQHDWVVLCKDERIRRRPAERDALIAGRVRAFYLTNANLTFAEQAEYFIRNRFRIIQRSRRPGPYLYGVYKDRIQKLWPKD